MHRRRRTTSRLRLVSLEILEARQLLTYTPPTLQITPFNYYNGPLAGTTSPSTGVAIPQVTSQAGVAYGSGGVSPKSPALLSSDGFGSVSAGFQLGWTNLTGFGNVGAGSPFGKGMDNAALPYLVQGSSSGIDAITGSGNALFFASSGSGYSPQLFTTDTLATNATSGYTITQGDGTVLNFYGFGSGVPVKQQGQLAGYVDAHGNATTTAYNGSGQLTAVQRSDGTNAETYAYTYLTSGDNAGKVSNVALQRGPTGGSMTTIRQVALAYYLDGDSSGNTGDLKTETEENGSGDPLGTTYFRYYTSTGDLGKIDALKYQLNDQSYARLAASLSGGVTPLTATDSEVAYYADMAYEYDSDYHVDRAILQGNGCSCSGSTGTGTYTYIYTPSTNSPGPNIWSTQIVETIPDTNQNVVYTNAVSEIMVSAFEDLNESDKIPVPAPLFGTRSGPIGGGSSPKVWVTAYRYDAISRLVLAAQPSAVPITTLSALNSAASSYSDILGYSSSTGGYQNLNSGAGLIDLIDYGSSTTATSSSAGDVTGYLKDHKVENGYSGTPVLLDSTQYFTRTAGGVTIAPVATSTVYRDTGGTGAETISYAYTWYSGTDQMQSLAVSSPVISSGQNGPGSADANTIFYDTEGRPVWTKDGDGFINYTAYDNATGAVVKSITDVDTSLTSGFTGLPSGWSTPTGGGLNLVTITVVDGLGRTTKVTSPNGNVAYIVYDDPDHEVRVYSGWNATSGTTTGPTQVTREDWAGGYTETLTMVATPSVSGSAGSYVPTGSEAIASLRTLSRTYNDNANRAIEQDQYFNLSGMTYSTSAHIGSAGTNYHATTYGYDERGRLDLIDNAVGTITITIYDGLGRAAAVYVGTDDSDFWTTNTSSNMTLVTWNQFDGSDIGDGNLTSTTEYPNSTSGDNRVTLHAYDWRDRMVATKSGDQLSAGPESSLTNRPIVFFTYDNLGEMTSVAKYDGDGVTLSSSAPSSSLLRAYVVASYDDQGRAFQQQRYSVNQSTGTVSTYALTTNTYYDHRGETIAVSSPGGLVVKTLYDGAGRPIVRSTTDGAAGTTWANAGSLTGDHVLSQTLMTYDADGNVILATTKDRFNSDTSTDTGALSNPTTGPAARVSYVAAYYDAADRPTAAANVGTNGGSAYTRPSSAPSRSDTVLVTSQHYNDAGWVDQATDPRGIVSQTSYDTLGRPTQVIAGYNASINGGLPTNSANQTTNLTYDGLGHTLTVTAVMPTGTSSQTTTNGYGVTISGGSVIASNDLMGTLTQPGVSYSGASATTTYTYDALGEVITATDPNGSTHTYLYDSVGRRVSDAVTTLGSGVDGAVRRITTAYDTAGRPYLFTSYNAASGGTVVNQVQNVYNGLGQLTGQYQAVGGSVNTSTTPEVQYAYTEMSGGQDNSRMTSMTYPNGRVLDYVYNTVLDTTISRLSGIVDDATSVTLESYTYLGLGTIVARNHPQSGVNLTYIQQSGDAAANTDGGDPYTGLDRFGRVIDQNWLTASAGTSVARYQYDYDRSGNVLSRNDLVETALSELYHANSSASGDNATAYDALGRLTGFARGVLSSSGHNGTSLDTVSSSSASQSWSLDALGNMTGVTTNGTTVTQGFNTLDQQTSTSSGTAPTYDADGNTLTSGGFTYTYDAWNRLAAVSTTSTSAAVASYSYDATGRRIVESYAGGTTTNLYYSPDWHVIEERQGGTASSNVLYQYILGATGNVVVRDTYSGGSLVSGSRLYTVWDANGDITAISNSSGSVQERYAYSPYGLVTVLTASGTAVSGNVSRYGWSYLFQGGRRDGATGLYIFQHRDYNPNSGTWQERDPSGLAGGDLNENRFVGNNPTDRIDPTGLDWTSWLPWNWSRLPEEAADQWLTLQNQETQLILQMNKILGTKYSSISQFAPPERALLEFRLGISIDWSAFPSVAINEMAQQTIVISYVSEGLLYVAAAADATAALLIIGNYVAISKCPLSHLGKTDLAIVQTVLSRINNTRNYELFLEQLVRVTASAGFQVTRIGTFYGKNIFGSLTSGLGFMELNGKIVVVRVMGGVIKILGSL